MSKRHHNGYDPIFRDGVHLGYTRTLAMATGEGDAMAIGVFDVDYKMIGAQTHLSEARRVLIEWQAICANHKDHPLRPSTARAIETATVQYVPA